MKFLKETRPQRAEQKEVVDYRTYRLSYKEMFCLLVAGTVVFGIIGYAFYDCWYLAILESTAWIPQKHMAERWLCKKRQQLIAGQFREALISIQASIIAGYSIENSIREALREMESLYGREAWIVIEFRYIVYRLQMGQTVGAMIAEFASRTGVEEILQFSQIFETAKRTGGNLAELARITGETIGERLTVEQELAAIMNSRRYEQRIMDVVPVGIVLYVRAASDGLLDIMYHNGSGYLIMSILLAVYLSAIWLGEKMTKIEM